jgi:hypothetical protein
VSLRWDAEQLPSEEEIIAAIPLEGIDIAGLSNAFRNKVPKARQKEFISLVRRVTNFDIATKRITRRE